MLFTRSSEPVKNKNNKQNAKNLFSTKKLHIKQLHSSQVNTNEGFFTWEMKELHTFSQPKDNNTFVANREWSSTMKSLVPWTEGVISRFQEHVWKIWFYLTTAFITQGKDLFQRAVIDMLLCIRTHGSCSNQFCTLFDIFFHELFVEFWTQGIINEFLPLKRVWKLN